MRLRLGHCARLLSRLLYSARVGTRLLHRTLNRAWWFGGPELRTRLLNRRRLRQGSRARLLRFGRCARLLEPLLLNRPRLLFERPGLRLRPELLLRRCNGSGLRRGTHFLRLSPTLVSVLHAVLVIAHLGRRTIVTGWVRRLAG